MKDESSEKMTWATFFLVWIVIISMGVLLGWGFIELITWITSL